MKQKTVSFISNFHRYKPFAHILSNTKLFCLFYLKTSVKKLIYKILRNHYFLVGSRKNITFSLFLDLKVHFINNANSLLL